MILSQLVLQLLLSALLGAIIGAERDIFNKKDIDIKERPNFGGIRTFALISLFGGVSVAVDKLLGSGNYVLITSIIIIGLFTLVSYIYGVFRKEQLGLTTEIAVFLTYFLGVFVVLGFSKFAVILSIIITFILSMKDFLFKIKEKISREELSNTLKFAVISVVILPLLKDVKYSIFQVLQFLGYSADSLDLPIVNIEFFNPYGIWFFVVLMSAISYVGYMLSKFIGEKNSIVASGAIGGLISSTAVTASMTESSKKDKKNIDLYVVGTLLASTIMFIRVVLIVLFFNIDMINAITVPALFMLIGMGLYIYYFYHKSKNEKLNTTISEIKSDYKSPFTIGPAIKFAGFVLFIKFISAVGAEYKDIWGDYFYYTLGIISGLADVDAISQTMSVDAKDGKLLTGVASTTIIIAVLSNNLVKGMIARRFGEKRFGNTVMGGFLFSMLFGIVGLVLLKIVE